MGNKRRRSKPKENIRDSGSDQEEMRKSNLEDEGEADDEGEEYETTSSSKQNDETTNAEGDATMSDDREYEVESIINDRKYKGKTQYLVHWRGFPNSQDTWENGENLDCPEILKVYLRDKEKSNSDDENTEVSTVSKEKGKKRVSKKTQGNSRNKKAKGDVKPDENGEFVVNRIIDMHVAKNGKHEYLVVWKGFPFSESSWEPEDNVKDTAAYDRFLKKLDEAKSASMKQLRVSRRPTDRFTLSPQSNERRLSRRFMNKQRARYFEAE